MDISSFIVPGILFLVSLVALRKRVDVYSAMVQGITRGMPVLLRIVPSLIVLLCACRMLQESGALDSLTTLLRPLMCRLGIPEQATPLLLIRPLSGSGALAFGSELMRTYGPDSTIGRTAAVMLGCTETTFYTIAVYFGAAGIRRTRYTLWAALTADLVGFVAAALSVKLLFGA